MSRYKKLKFGEAFRVDLAKGSLMEACCDCGSVHLWQFHHIKDDVWDFAVFPQPRRTAQLRRHNYGFLQQEGKFI